jgi:HEAT repeat protein
MAPGLRLSLAVAAALSTLGSAGARGQQATAPADLLNQFRSATVFWRQFEVAKQIARMGDTGVLEELEPWLQQDDRHLRGNAAFVFASLGDPRGVETIRTMLTDRSDRPLGQGIPGAPGNPATPRWWLREQVRADRYYAVHLFGELKDPRAVDILVPLLGDEDINYKVAWALSEIGDRRAIRPLIAALKDRDALMRVSAIRALEKLDATEALPQLRALLNDQALPRAGDQVSVGETAKAAIARLQKEPGPTKGTKPPPGPGPPMA